MKKFRPLYEKRLLPLLILAWVFMLGQAFSLNLETQKKELSDRLEQLEADRKAQEAQDTEAEGQDAAQELNGQETTQTPAVLPASEPLIRVLLTDSEYAACVHPFVTVTLEGESITYTSDSRQLSGGSLVLDNGEEGIEVTSIQRQEQCPVYQGTLELRKYEGGLLLINELPLETYLEAVVPSEMPSSYDMEALMAQAICARTYACRQMEAEGLKEYGADVDDSVNYQVYWNIPPTQRTTQAVQSTRGKVLCQDGELIEAYYFSTSPGVTSTDEIWGADQPAGYLKSVACTYDAQEPWGSWSVTVPWENLALRAVGFEDCGGALTGLEIIKKNQSGAVTGLRILTEDGIAEIYGEYHIREFLSPEGCEITEQDGTGVPGGELLPSAYFTMELFPGESVQIEGKGYGHGVGMSQTAADEMAKEGMSCQEILHYFYKDVTLETIGE